MLGRGRRRLRKLNGASNLKVCFVVEEVLVEELVEEVLVEEELVEEVSKPSAPSARSPAAQTYVVND